MDEIEIRDVVDDNIEDLCCVCVPLEKRDDPGFIKGVEEKEKWAIEMLHQSIQGYRLARNFRCAQALREGTTESEGRMG